MEQFSSLSLGEFDDEIVFVKKKLCNKCGFMVKVDGHDSRCVPQPRVPDSKFVSRAEDWDKRRHRAWIGDSVHRLDVQLIALYKKIQGPELEGFVQSYVSGEAQADYWRSILDKSDLAQPQSSGTHALSSAFECNYSGWFRSEYLVRKFGELGAKAVNKWKPPDLLGK